MYLKQIEITGFKSFAEKTKLQFESGMIAIVGPNGCGKSNVSDAIRWVLGEQRPTALRCSKMADVVFNGTDGRKPLGMAEVSITFTDCEGVLDTEFNEVTITRRVFRTGEGQYFINKNLCRLKDVQRLFMGTGIGTTSYSVMAQGQIDAILSSRPEDRRAVFEEAAGITKFKADRKEATRKIEQTEANLLRLADVIREVKRQIGTLQRQAGKAQKFRELREELRGLDIFLTRRRLAALDLRLRELDITMHQLAGEVIEHQEVVAEAEGESARIHATIRETEERIGALTEQAAQADGKYARAQEVIKVNQQRIEEYRVWAERDNHEISEIRAQIETLNLQVESLEQKRLLIEQAATVEGDKLTEAQTRFDEHKTRIEETRTILQRDRQRSLECERRVNQIQQTLNEMEQQQRAALMKRERLSAEQEQTLEGLRSVEETLAQVNQRLQKLRDAGGSVEEHLTCFEEERASSSAELQRLQESFTQAQAEASAKRAQVELLSDRGETEDEFGAGARQMLDPANPLKLPEQAVLGTLAEQFNAPSELRLALEAALRAWLDAVAVRDEESVRTALTALLAGGEGGAARMVVVEGALPSTAKSGATRQLTEATGLVPLLELVEVTPQFQVAAKRLLGAVWLADSLAQVPTNLPEGVSVVTRDGAMLRADGCYELWMPDSQVSSPLARRLLLTETVSQLEQLERQLGGQRTQLERLNTRLTELTVQINQTRQERDHNQRLTAQAEGEYQALNRDAERTRERLNAAQKELLSLAEQTAGDDQQRDTLNDELKTLNHERDELLEKTGELSYFLQELEGVYGELSHALTECRIRVSSLTQQLEYTESQRESIESRMEELERTIQGRSRGVLSYDQSIERLKVEIGELESGLEPMRLAAEELHRKVDEIRQERATRYRELEKNDAVLSERRRALDTTRDNRGKAEVEMTESRMRHQTQLDHIYNEYGLSAEELVAHADPTWGSEGQPPVPQIEARVGQLNKAIQDLGPVNMVAIEEYKELEERFTFLRAQEQDLLKSKEQILELITVINQKSSELFQSTFEQANANFEAMFAKLFNGGQAKLVLLENAADPLECGIDIIARPPGKRPQSVTLLSGGERTMTAVSLLFAIFMIKPSPFCMLDELDAALDDSNIGRFVQALKEFLQHSQFLIITHNQHTIAESDIVYGVTQQEKGVSKVVSMRLNDIGAKELEAGAVPEVTVEEDVATSQKRRKKAATSAK